MPALSAQMHSLLHEHQALMTQYGKAQLRCSALLASQAQEISTLQAQVIQLRARAMVQITALAWEREDTAAFKAAVPGLPHRVELARRVQNLLERVQNLMREKQKWLWGAAPPDAAATKAASGKPASVQVGELLNVSVMTRPVLWITPNTMAIAASQNLPGREASPLSGLNISNGDDEAALELSLAAADMVICQTGCLSHNAYWRVQDHCKRTGKTCVLMDDAGNSGFGLLSDTSNAGKSV
ncbi:MAG: DUF2325 domain-containing protein [Pseudomonadota bacterium]